MAEQNDVTRMSSDDLAKFIDNPPAGETPEVMDEGQETVQEGEAQDQTKAAAEGEAAEAGGKPDEAIPDEKLKALLDENAALKKKTEHQEKYLARLGTELGMLRKESPEEELAEIQRLRDLNFEDPIAFQKEFKAWEQKQEAKNQAAQVETLKKKVMQTAESVLAMHPQFAEHVDDMAEAMKEDGASQEVIDNFKRLPYVFDQISLHNLLKRAQQRKEISTLKADNEKLKAENEELRKKPSDILRNIQNAPRTLNGKSGGAAAGPGKAYKPVVSMTSEELEKFLTNQ